MHIYIKHKTPSGSEARWSHWITATPTDSFAPDLYSGVEIAAVWLEGTMEGGPISQEGRWRRGTRTGVHDQSSRPNIQNDRQVGSGDAP